MINLPIFTAAGVLGVLFGWAAVSPTRWLRWSGLILSLLYGAAYLWLYNAILPLGSPRQVSVGLLYYPMGALPLAPIAIGALPRLAVRKLRSAFSPAQPT
ncbi:hypothetical protein ABEG18_19010 [Alsobacter sp. KACC 23698]|uniref:Uncharacterized protein n=1 Tax=Alsobacter sp. KACC 23698 TaxID=3149229 RepID=A0AAU7JBX5_9HYPH